MKSVMSALVVGCFSVACVPPAAETPPVNEPEPAEPESSGGIPWAAGEAPSDAESTTRDVGPEPRTHEIPDEPVRDDGISVTPPSQACSGRVPPLLRSSVQLRADETRDCYNSVPEEKVGAKGEVRVQISVAPNGSVKKLEVVSDTFGVPEATQCIEKVLSRAFDVGPRGGCALFVIPVNLAAKEEPSQPTSTGSAGEEAAPVEEVKAAE